MIDSPHEHEPLSPAGEARRAAMLIALRAEVVHVAARRRAMRRIARASAAAASLALVAAAAAWLALPRAAAPVGPIAKTPAPAAPTWTRIHTDPSIADRLAVESRADLVSLRLTDDELLDRLDALGHPAGIVRIGSETWLTSLDGRPIPGGM